VIYRGKPSGNKITGSCDFDFDGNTGTMEFTGERTPPKEKAAPAEPAKEAKAAAPAADAKPADSAAPAEKSE